MVMFSHRIKIGIIPEMIDMANFYVRVRHNS